MIVINILLEIKFKVSNNLIILKPLALAMMILLENDKIFLLKNV